MRLAAGSGREWQDFRLWTLDFRPCAMTQSKRISYVLMAVLLVLVGWLHMATLVLTAFFGYFALTVLSFGRSKLLSVSLYLVLVVAIGFGLFYFSRQAYKTLPRIAEDTIPKVIEYAERQGVELPFTDYESLRALALDEAKEIGRASCRERV